MLALSLGQSRRDRCMAFRSFPARQFIFPPHNTGVSSSILGRHERVGFFEGQQLSDGSMDGFAVLLFLVVNVWLSLL